MTEQDTTTRLTNAALRAVAELSEAEPDSMDELRLKLRLDNIRFAMERGIYE
jgi:tartrate dehydratase alpha subunit/fumarate hydratase class I-like protein